LGLITRGRPRSRRSAHGSSTIQIQPHPGNDATTNCVDSTVIAIIAFRIDA
jgi:hypothetical protein